MATRYKGTPAETRALDAYVKLLRAANTVQAVLDRRLHGLGLTENQFGVLEALFHLGPLSQRDLGAKLLTTGGNITMVVDHLAARGLARRVRGEADRRIVTVHLTAEGRRLIGSIFPGHVAAIVEVFSALPGAEQLALARLCRRLGLAARERLAPPPARR